jgi:hypothetical protein
MRDSRAASALRRTHEPAKSFKKIHLYVLCGFFKELGYDRFRLFDLYWGAARKQVAARTILDIPTINLSALFSIKKTWLCRWLI